MYIFLFFSILFFAGAAYNAWNGVFTEALGGWWGIPWGPIETMKTIARNIRGGHQIHVAHLLEQ